MRRSARALERRIYAAAKNFVVRLCHSEADHKPLPLKRKHAIFSKQLCSRKRIMNNELAKAISTCAIRGIPP
jgi:hypothetical protein